MGFWNSIKRGTTTLERGLESEFPGIKAARESIQQRSFTPEIKFLQARPKEISQQLKTPEGIMGFAGIPPEEAGVKVSKGFFGGMKPLSRFTTSIKKVLGKAQEFLEPAAPVIRKFGGETYAHVIKAIHAPETEKVTFDNLFQNLEKDFGKMSKEDLKNFNLTRGIAQTEEAKLFQREAELKLPLHLRDRELTQSVKQASDYVFNLAKSKGLDMSYFEDYFYGSYKDEKKVTNFLDYWRSTKKFTKEKTIPSIADAHAFGLELKNPNPITNIKEELTAVSKRVGFKDLRDHIEREARNYAISAEKATKEHLSKWEKINDPVFKGMLFEPSYARLVNNLISTNLIRSSKAGGILKGLSNTAYTLRTIKFFGSIFHMQNELKAAISSQAMGVADPRGYMSFLKSFKSIDTNLPEYKEYVGLGGGHRFSLESQTIQSLGSLFEKTGIKNVAEKLGKGYEKTKFIPASPEFIRWMFDDFIPKLKFQNYTQKIVNSSRKLGRELTDFEKIKIIRENQNFFGEMNERLFGRSGTATSLLRLIFTAPGYGEGNFRAFGKALRGEAKSAQFVINSLITSAIAASVGTRVLTGKWPDVPKHLNDIRDLFKIKTSLKDGNGDAVFYDMMTYDKDFWSLGGNAVTQPGQIAPDLLKRVSGAENPGFKTLVDLTDMFAGKTLYDFKGTPVFFNTDSLGVKLSKFIQHEGIELQPISVSTLEQSIKKGTPITGAGISSIVGIRPTTSEAVKRTKAARQDLFSLQDTKRAKQIELNKLANENQEEAIKEAKEFNKEQKRKLIELLKSQGIKELPEKDLSKFIIRNLKKGKPKEGTRLF